MSDGSGFQVPTEAAKRYQRQTAIFMLPLARHLLDVAAVRDGDHVLDVACGPGFAAVEATGRVGPSGRVVGLDVNEGMIEAARRGARTVPDVEWVLGSAMDLPFDDDTFDAVVCQQGIQFFPDLAVAVAEMRRVTRPGGVVAATNWTPMDTVPYLDAVHSALSEHVEGEALASLAGTFGLDGDQMQDAWSAGGLTEIERTIHAPMVALPPLAEFVVDQTRAVPWGAAFDTLDEDAQAQVVERVVELLDHRTETGETVVPFSTWVITGRA